MPFTLLRKLKRARVAALGTAIGALVVLGACSSGTGGANSATSGPGGTRGASATTAPASTAGANGTTGGAATTSSKPASSGAASSASGATSAAGAPQSAAGGPTPSYGSEEFGLSLADLSTKVEQTEAAIGVCMKSAGLAYVPLDFASVKKAMDSDQSKPGLGDEEYRKQYGFGISTQLDNPIAVFAAGPENTKIYNALPEASKAAYRRTLWGENTEWTLVKAIEYEDLSQTGGCTRKAVEANFSAVELKANYINPADVLIEQDKRMIKAIENWSGCMRKAGFTYSKPDDATADITERFKAIVQGRDPKTLTGPDQDALKALQADERAIAVAALTCEEKYITKVQDQVEAEIFGSRPS